MNQSAVGSSYYINQLIHFSWSVNNLIPHFIHEQHLRNQRLGSFEAYALFVDLSGFTRLTETLMTKGNEGAERLSGILNAIFQPMVSLVYKHHGFIPYFAGDAFTGIFPVNEHPHEAEEILELAQHQFKLLDDATRNLKDFQIGLKMGISYGKVNWGIVGHNHLSFYFRGPAIMNSANCHLKAKNLEIIADQNFINRTKSPLKYSQTGHDGFYSIPKSTPLSPHRFLKKPTALPELTEDVSSLFIPKPIAEYNQQGEFRTVVSVFLSFEGLDEHHQLDGFASVVIEQVYAFSGYFKEIDFGDKGGVMVVIFGAPVSFENNVERALEFVNSLKDELEPMIEESGLRYKVGIASGIAFTGIVGCKERCQYAAVGNRVNIAARLMMYADWNEVLVDGEIQKSRHFQFKGKGDISYKGLKEPIPTHQLIGRNLEYRYSYEGSMVGRMPEMELLVNFARDSLTGSYAAVAYIYGEAGIGKTRMAFELRKRMKRKRRMLWFTCPSDQILRKSFNPFIFFLRNYFEQSSNNTLAENLYKFDSQFDGLITALFELPEEESASIKREIIRIKPILAALVGLKTGDTLWERLDAKGRYENTFAALSSLFEAETLFQPFVIELEDGHSFDDSSKEFLNDFCGRVKNNPVLFLVTSRYDDEGNKPRLIDDAVLQKNGIPVLELDLNVLEEGALEALAFDKLGNSTNPELLEMLVKTSNGNPFYAEQTLEYLQESESLIFQNDVWHLKVGEVDISKGFQAILTARIDRLSPEVKETVKAAAVIGREFDLPVLTEVMKDNGDYNRLKKNHQTSLKDSVRTAERAQIWRAINEQRYIFRHSLLRDAVYTMQLKSRQKQLHRLTAEAIEKIYSESLEQRYVDLVFHYEQSRVESKLQHYLEKAADHARSHYQNRQALHFYDRLYAIHEKSGTPEQVAITLINKGTILELTGQWDECEPLYRKALEFASKTESSSLLGKANNTLGNFLMLKGKYFEADKLLETAAAFFGSAHDNNGISRVYGNLGTLYFRQGKYDTAKLYFIRSIQLAQLYDHTSFNAHNVATLGLTYMSLGKYDEGIRWQQNQLDICKKLNDKLGMATLYVNIGLVYSEKGDYDEALENYQKGFALSEELGNKQLISIVTGGIGSVYQRKGKFELAMQNCERSLAYAEELGDKHGIANALGLIGEIHTITGQFDLAIQFLEKNIEISKVLGDRKGVAKAVNTLGDVYFYKNELEMSMQHYDRSINLTRSIGNKLVLGFSLAEKGTVLLAMEKMEDVRDHFDEAADVASELAQPELIFVTNLLFVRLNIATGQYDKASEILELMLAKVRNKSEEAEIYFEYAKISQDDEHKKKAISLFEELYKEMPMYVFKLRLQQMLKTDKAPTKTP